VPDATVEIGQQCSCFAGDHGHLDIWAGKLLNGLERLPNRFYQYLDSAVCSPRKNCRPEISSSFPKVAQDVTLEVFQISAKLGLGRSRRPKTDDRLTPPS